ncbi:hypothetical protein D3C81_1196020 [compost metagenome]
MPNSTRETVLCRYHYDPLDRQNGCTALQQPVIQRFHCKSRLATEIQGSARWSIFQQDDQLLAQHSHLDAKVTATLLTTDQQRSVLNALEATQPNPLAYTPYGHRPAKNSLLSLLGFNGERPDPVTGHYHLGNGYRQFNPVLMRFNSPDSWSPFGEGGLNAYAYCGGDPRNRIDRTGHAWHSFLSKLSELRPIPKIPRIKVNPKSVKTTLSQQRTSTENTMYLDHHGLPLKRVINNDGKIFKVPTETLRRTQEPARAKVQVQVQVQKQNRASANIQSRRNAPEEYSDQMSQTSNESNRDSSWYIKQEFKLEKARKGERHSHNSNEVNYYNEKIRNGPPKNGDVKKWMKKWGRIYLENGDRFI